MAGEMSGLVLLIIGAGSGFVAALFGVLCFVRLKPSPDILTTQIAAQFLRSETDNRLATA
jgi:hypothetical protein